MSKDRSRNNTSKVSAKPLDQVKRQLNAWPIVASLSILAYGLYRAIDLRWICDDAFITMRYVKNFVEGNGLVYNVGERVEGYTHFLWLLLLAASKVIGFDPVDSSIWLGIASYAGILVLLIGISLHEHKKNSKVLWLPLAAGLFALNYDTAEWASGGLETSFYTLLILASFYIWFYSGWTERRRSLLTGAALALVSLTRPDGVLFTATAVALLAVNGMKKRQSVLSTSKSIGILIFPSVAIGLPYLIWKYFYYGDLLPLTYYAKSGDENYLGQGFYYIWLYFRVHFMSAIALIAGAWLLLRHRGNDEKPSNSLHAGSPVITAFVCIAVYLILFVARSGGDFMFARFIIPIVPFLYFVIERAMNCLEVKAGWHRIGIAAVLLASAIVEDRLPIQEFFHLNDDGRREEDWELVSKGTTRFIADERYYYYDHFQISTIQRGRMDIYTEVGKYLEPFFKGLPVTVAIPGAMNMTAYYANYSTAINEYGLTDAYIAHSALSSRGHIGHEKKAPEEYLIKKNVDFELEGMVSEFPKQVGPTTILFEMPELGIWQVARLVTYNKTLMNELARRFAVAGSRSMIPIYENFIAEYIEKGMPGYPLDRIENDYAGFRQYYFNKYPDSALENRFEKRIAELKRDSIAHK